MLKFRNIDYDQDLGEIIKLIQKDLDSNFTLELFKWKHLENPFGSSYGLLAVDGDKIVGVRMFMFWKFFNPKSKNVVTAIRPVDTVVDGGYRGQGLFKKLTLTGLEECKEEYDFIFNTPNENSLPGYLKMGWQKNDLLKYFKVALVNPFKKSLSNINIAPQKINLEGNKILTDNRISTYISPDYLMWRYKSEKYKIAYFQEEQVYVSYSISEAKYLIIYEVFGTIHSISSNIFNSIALKYKKPLIYFYNNDNFLNTNFLIAFKRRKPVVVTKNPHKNPLVEQLQFSLADLEAVF